MLYTYDFSQVSITVGGFTMTGLAEGDCLTIETDAELFTLKIGADGEGARNKSCNRAAKATIRLMQSSASNDILSGFQKADQLANAGIVPVMVKDGSGRSLHFAENAWLEKQPTATYGAESGVREWVFRSDNMQHYVGGN